MGFGGVWWDSVVCGGIRWCVVGFGGVWWDSVVCGVWCVVCGVWCVVCGVWCVVCGVWCVVCGVWCVLCVVVGCGGMWWDVVCGVCGVFVFDQNKPYFCISHLAFMTSEEMHNQDKVK